MSIDDDVEAEDIGLVSSRSALAAAALRRALGTSGIRRLVSSPARAIVIQVPTAQWVEPIAAEVRRLAPSATWVGTQKKGFTEEVATATATGESVVGVSENPTNTLPQLLVDVATDRFAVTPPDAKILQEAMSACLVGRAPALLSRLNASTLDFDVLCALMPKGTRKVEAVRRIEAAIRARATAVTGTGLALPALQDAVEYGQAREWGLELEQDLRDLRAGRIRWDAIDKGILLVGEPGTGKTTFSQILAASCDVPLIKGSVPELFASSPGFLDSVIKAQRKLFATAAAAAPCILFLDEISAYPNEANLSLDRGTPTTGCRSFWISTFCSTPRCTIAKASS